MTTSTLTLTDFLPARIAEDEADVHAGPGNMRNYGLRWSPARVLAECEAKRRIVEAHPHSDPVEWPTGLWCLTCQWDICCDQPGTNTSRDTGKWPCPTLRALAAVYADWLGRVRHPEDEEAPE